MKCKESFVGSKNEGLRFLNTMLSKLLKGELKLEGERVFLPKDQEYEFKVKFEYDEEHDYGSFSIKIAWGEEPECEDEEEEDDEDEDELFNQDPDDYYR